MTLKIEMYPAFMNECLFEVKCRNKSCRLLIARSAMPELDDMGAVYNLEIKGQEAIDRLTEMLFRFVKHPTPKTTVVIADGLAFKISYASESRSFQYHLSSIQENSIESDFVHHLFRICHAHVSDIKFNSYLEEVESLY